MDGDSFFVACEVAKNPKLKGLPVVTGEERGIASALSYEAKALGLSRGTPIYRIKKDFPQVMILPGDYLSYSKYSEKMFDIVRRYADVVEEYSIDECFADLTGLDKPLYMTYGEIARRIKKEITDGLGLSISVGLAPTKSLAKLASKWQKPNGLTIIEGGKAFEYLRKTPIEKIWGIGGRTSEFLKRRGISTAADFARKNIEWIRANLSKPFEVIWLELNGTPVMKIHGEAKTSYSSIQKTRTFSPPTNNQDFLLGQLSKNTEEACRKARYYNLSPKGFAFFLKTQGFKYCNFSEDLAVRTNSPEKIISLISQNFKKVWKEGVLYRTTGVTLYGLDKNLLIQGNLFGEGVEESKFEIIHKQIDALEEKFGKKVIHLASTHNTLKRKVRGTDAEDLDRNLLFL